MYTEAINIVPSKHQPSLLHLHTLAHIRCVSPICTTRKDGPWHREAQAVPLAPVASRADAAARLASDPLQRYGPVTIREALLMYRRQNTCIPPLYRLHGWIEWLEQSISRSSRERFWGHDIRSYLELTLSSQTHLLQFDSKDIRGIHSVVLVYPLPQHQPQLFQRSVPFRTAITEGRRGRVRLVGHCRSAYRLQRVHPQRSPVRVQCSRELVGSSNAQQSHNVPSFGTTLQYKMVYVCSTVRKQGARASHVV